VAERLITPDELRRIAEEKEIEKMREALEKKRELRFVGDVNRQNSVSARSRASSTASSTRSQHARSRGWATEATLAGSSAQPSRINGPAHSRCAAMTAAIAGHSASWPLMQY
jgi:hypothetical protein